MIHWRRSEIVSPTLVWVNFIRVFRKKSKGIGDVKGLKTKDYDHMELSDVGYNRVFKRWGLASGSVGTGRLKVACCCTLESE